MTSTDSPGYISRYLDHYPGVTARSLIRTPPLSESHSLLTQEGNLRSAKKSLKFESDAGWVGICSNDIDVTTEHFLFSQSMFQQYLFIRTAIINFWIFSGRCKN